MFFIHKCKRDEYISAWKDIYNRKKDKINSNPLFDEVNPMLNKTALKTEIDNYCVVAYDNSIYSENFKYGTPVGVFSFVVTNSKVIGKQFAVDPDYHGRGLGKALLLANEKQLLDHDIKRYYIGCSKCSSGILKQWGEVPYSENVEKDMFKYWIDLPRDNMSDLYKECITDKYIQVI